MIHRRFANVLFALILSSMVSLFISCVVTWRTLGLVEGFVGLSLSAWLAAWPAAFLGVLILAPLVRRIVGALTRDC